MNNNLVCFTRLLFFVTVECELLFPFAAYDCSFRLSPMRTCTTKEKCSGPISIVGTIRGLMLANHNWIVNWYMQNKVIILTCSPKPCPFHH